MDTNHPQPAAHPLRFTRYQIQHQEPMLALHRAAIEGFTLGISREEDEADLRAIDQVYLRDGGEFLALTRPAMVFRNWAYSQGISILQ